MTPTQVSHKSLQVEELTTATIEGVIHGHRAAALGALGVLAYLAIGVWTVVNFLETDWVMGGIGATCVLVGVPKLISTVQRMRRQERRGSQPTHTTPG